jgi:hypothetical protein
MADGVDTDDTDLVAYYAFDDGTAADLSGNGYDGVINGPVVAYEDIKELTGSGYDGEPIGAVVSTCDSVMDMSSAGIDGASEGAAFDAVFDAGSGSVYDNDGVVIGGAATADVDVAISALYTNGAVSVYGGEMLDLSSIAEDSGARDDASVSGASAMEENTAEDISAGGGGIVYEGSNALKLGGISDGERCIVSKEVSLAYAGALSFAWKVSSEEDKDLFSFYVDGILISAISGEPGWAQIAEGLSAGDHLLEWIYSKDASGAAGEDAGWVDDVRVTSGADLVSLDMFEPDGERNVVMYLDGELVTDNELVAGLLSIKDTPGAGVQVVSNDIFGGVDGYINDGEVSFTTALLDAEPAYVSGGLTECIRPRG